MKVYLLLFLLPCLVASQEVCPGGLLTCPEGKNCCEVGGQQSCCGRGKRDVLQAEVSILEEGSYTNASIVDGQQQAFGSCDWRTCSGTCCSGGCCPFTYAECCSSTFCCRSGNTCCGINGCCPSTHICSGSTCCPLGYRGCGSWCCPNNFRCGKKFMTCGGSNLAPTAIVLLGVATMLVARKTSLF